MLLLGRMLPSLFFVFLLSLLFQLTLSLNQEGVFLHRVKLALSDPAGSLSSWSDRDATPCNWTGVTCDPSTLAVTEIALPEASLSGPFPILLCRLPSLSRLFLSNNSINSSLPTAISTCRNLTHLDLSQNLLVGPIPSSISDLQNLRYLNFDGNGLSGEIPASFGLFRRLETLIITGNFLNGTISSHLGNITSLKSLELAYNPFTPGRLSPELGNLSNLENLWLTGCNLVGSIPESFAKLIRLSNFDVSNNLLNGSIPSLIFKLKSIVQIELYNNSFTGGLPVVGWSNLTALRRFDASMNHLVGTIPYELCELPLESLGLYGNQLVGSIPESIARSPNLYDLRLFNNRFTGRLPYELGKNSPLKTIDVSENQLSGEIPPNLCEKGALGQLIIIYNSFSGNIPASLAKCQSLSRVRLRSNQLRGEVPPEFWGLPHVYLLDLYGNSFSGTISSKISTAHNLSTLLISKNKFSGTLPNEIGSLHSLVEFSVSDNELTGEIPDTIIQLGQLGTLDLSKNKLTGKIPAGMESLKQLNELNLAKNRLSGEIPDEIGMMQGLNYLDLSENQFSGKIPLDLQNLKLNTLNLSHNLLVGEIPPLFAKQVYKDSFLGNPGLCDGLTVLCQNRGRGTNHRYLWILRTIFISAAIVSLVGILWFIVMYCNIDKSKKGMTMTILKWRSFHKLGFSEFEIMNCLSEDNIIGSGASGKVYKAVLSNGEVVAVKRLWGRKSNDKEEEESANSEKDEFEAEVETLGNIRHKNIVRLWCCCNAGSCKLLVYEYMPNGSLGDLLHGSNGGSLKWPTRFGIALDAAEGLSYLHHDCVPPIVHRDVKSNNILLDGEFGARIADFGVAKFVESVNKRAESMSAIAGSCGYIAPEYAYTLRVNEKSDIYSFGVVILELVTGRRPVDPEFGERDLAKWVCATLDSKGVEGVVDPNLGSGFTDQIRRVLDIALLCVSPLPINRPSMRKIVNMLLEAATVTAVDAKPKLGKNGGKLSPYYYYEDDASDQGSLQ